MPYDYVTVCQVYLCFYPVLIIYSWLRLFHNTLTVVRVPMLILTFVAKCHHEVHILLSSLPFLSLGVIGGGGGWS